jgi:hypothetical protein
MACCFFVLQMEVKLKRRGFPFLVLGKCWVFDPGEEE